MGRFLRNHRHDVCNRWLVMWNEASIRAHTAPLWTGIELMRKYDALLQEYCTRKCDQCPLSRYCNWDGIIYHEDEGLTEKLIMDYVDFSGKADF